MYNFIQFILRFGSFFLFLLFESISVYLVVNYNISQRDIFLNSANIVSGKVNEKFARLEGFVNQYTIIDSIAKENSVLYQERFNYPFLFDTLDRVRDTMIRVQVIPATVVDNSVSTHHNYLLINRGTNNGVQKGMAVISHQGIVGIIKRCSKNYSLVLSVLNEESKISAIIRRNGYFGSLIWDGKDPNILTLEDIPRHAEIMVGDTIETSGYSLSFPKGIFIGRVQSVTLKKGTNFYAIQCKTENNLSNIKIVYVVNNSSRQEIEELNTDVNINK